MTPLILSIDQSTSATKAMVWTTDGKLLSREDIPHRQITSSVGWVAHDGMEILENTYEAAKRAIKDMDSSRIRVIGISNQRETALCWDRNTGLPLHNAIVWQCARAADIADHVKAAELENYVRTTTGLNLSPFFSAAKFGWMVKHIPEVAQAMANGSLCCGTVDSWLVFKLTGNFKTDYSNASRTQVLDLRNLRWDNILAEAFGIHTSCLPEICMSDSNFGMTDLDGLLPKPVPIHGVMGDSHGALFGNQCTMPFMAKVTYGTGSSVMMNAGTTCPAHLADGIAASVAYATNGKVHYALEGNINYTGAVIKWLVDDIELLQDAKSAGQIAKQVADTGGVYLVPAFTGLGAPYFNNHARAAFLGMNPATKKAHLVRAAEECIAYQIKDVVEAINKSTGKNISIIKADGGPTRDDFLMQFQSDILGIPIEVNQLEELSGLGVAFCAAIGAGLADSIPDLPRHKINPAMDDETCNKLYLDWKDAVNKLMEGMNTK